MTDRKQKESSKVYVNANLMAGIVEYTWCSFWIDERNDFIKLYHTDSLIWFKSSNDHGMQYHTETNFQVWRGLTSLNKTLCVWQCNVPSCGVAIKRDMGIALQDPLPTSQYIYFPIQIKYPWDLVSHHPLCPLLNPLSPSRTKFILTVK